ncbi:hypothetical protein [Sporomusa malonica]|uniref:Uncharacterized protein n=1 Tax=Sporomusa malonica TaxID=112901 RepID=A0A1W1ZRB7_9FIRM|nr:hypothetical protein [Sporomusa malonica]SMC50611.1 hypothetical protein SAMN04488500_104114 [Sporomusa malonica]
MATNDKPIHGMCVDKTSCRHEVILDKDGKMTLGGNEQSESQPTEHLTKDFICKQYDQSQKEFRK